MKSFTEYLNESQDSKLEKKARNIFVNIFAKRGDIEGVTPEIADAEWDLLMKNKSSMESYLLASRVGQKHALNRKTRKSMFLSFENSFNHASFE